LQRKGLIPRVKDVGTLLREYDDSFIVGEYLEKVHCLGNLNSIGAVLPGTTEVVFTRLSVFLYHSIQSFAALTESKNITLSSFAHGETPPPRMMYPV